MRDPKPASPSHKDRSASTAPIVTAVVLTLNEAQQLASCLGAIPSDVPVLVVDSGSSDGTTDLAVRLGARVEVRAWTGFADQRNFALQACDLHTEWVLFVDADEQYPEDFFTWMRSCLASAPSADAFDVPSMLYLDGKPLRHAPGYPILHPRLVRRSVTFRENHAGHGEALSPCQTARAPLGYNHFFHDGDMVSWLTKHVRLARHEALAQTSPTTRRGRLRQWAPKGPVRGVARFLYHYCLCGGFLDGSAGFRYSLMYAWYEITIYLIRGSR